MNRLGFTHRSTIVNQQLALLALLLVSFALRLHALLQLPGFVDEGNHLLWAAEAWQGRVIFPFSTAKPLEIFYLAALMPFRAPLWVGRFGSVLAGIVTLTGLWALARRRKQGRAGLWAAMFYAFTPWTFFHERTAAADPLLTANVVLMAWAAAVWADDREENSATGKAAWRSNFGLALCIFALPLVKFSAAPFAALPVVIVALNNWAALRRLWFPYALAIIAVGVVFVPAAMRYDVFGELAIRASTGQVMSWADFVRRNLRDLLNWSIVYLGLSGPLMVIGAVMAVTRRSWLGWAALAGCALGLAPGLLPATLFPRYYLPALAFASLLAAEAVDWALNRLRPPIRWGAGIVIAASVVLPFGLFAAQAYTDSSRLKLADIDRAQHVTDWSSGYGIREAAALAMEQAANDSQPAVVYSANLATGVIVRLYWPPEANGETYVLWDSASPDVIEAVASGKPAYLIVDTTRDKASFDGLAITPRELARFERPQGGQPVVVYRLTPTDH